MSLAGFSAQGLSHKAENKEMASWDLMGGAGKNSLPSSFR